MDVTKCIKWIALVLIFACPSVHGASFNCDQARSGVEKRICGTDELSSLDDRLGEVYRAAMQDASAKEVAQLKKEQVRWLQEVRNRCLDAACLLITYKKRLNELDPFADKKISCEEMRRFPKQIFTDGIDLGSGHGSPIDVDYACPESLSQQDFMQTLLSLAEQIRGDSGPQICSGSIVYAQWRYYSFRLTEAGIAPHMLLKSSESLHGGTDWSSLAQTGDSAGIIPYFKQWSEQSQSNLKLYSDFVTEFDRVFPQLVQRYEQKSGLPKSDAQAAVRTALMIPAARVAGSFPSNELSSESALVKLVRDSQVTANDIRRALDDRGADGGKLPEKDIYQALVVALLYNRPPTVVSLLAESLSPDTLQRPENGQEPLLSFAMGSQQNLEYLLKRQVPVNAANDFGKTSLFYAIGSNNHAAVETLLQHGANANQPYKSAKELRPDGDECTYYGLTHTRRTPLMHAAQHSDVEMLKLLVQAGSLLNAVDDLGFNALDYAVMGKHKENESYLKSMGLVFGAPIYTSDTDPAVHEQEIQETVPVGGFVSKLLVAPGRPSLLVAAVTPWDTLLANDKQGLYLISISDPDHPKVTSIFPGVYVNDFAVSQDGRRAYLMEIANNQAPPNKKFGVSIVDISNTEKPILVGHIDGDFMTMHLSPDGRFLYLQERELKPEFSRGLLVYGVGADDPVMKCSNPFGSVGVSRRVFAYAFTSFPDDSLLLINDRGARLLLFEFNDPCVPKKVLDVPAQGFGGVMTGEAHRTFIGGGDGELKRMRLGDPLVRVAGYAASVGAFSVNAATNITAAVIGRDVAIFRTDSNGGLVLSDRFRLVLPNSAGSVFQANSRHVYIGWKDGFGVGTIPKQ